MGCINSKQAESVASPALERSVSKAKAKAKATVAEAAASSAADNSNGGGGGGSVVSSKNPSGLLLLRSESSRKEDKSDDRNRELKRLRRDASVVKGSSFSFKLGFSHRFVDAEQTSAGWPSWLSTAAGEAIHGWVPLRADSFEKLEKIGQGTYSSVFRAREVETGKIVALKKVRFDNFQPESIRFMAREIMILRRLDHPNIMKLEGVIASRSSTSIYLVFDYMEHDLAGLVSCPDVKFSEAQVKCYMRQLLSAVEHCHLRGIMHRDIKVSNILVNNEGILKLGDFGLANVLSTSNKQPLTSRVVTLWYRPPELLMGSTTYGVSVDLWSVGCVFAELFLGKPILKGRTEVEQLHKIFKLCGSPPEEYWKRSKLPHATMFKPQNSYESSLREKCKEFPTSAVDLIETFLSIEPYKRGTASSALMSQYFRTKPYACDPATLPKYPPNKELDAKNREDARRRKPGARLRESGTVRKPRRTRKTFQESNTINKLPPKEDAQENSQYIRRNNSNTTVQILKPRGGGQRRESLKLPFDTVSEACQVSDTQGGDSTFSGPVPVSASSGFAWAKRRKGDVTSAVSDTTRSQFSLLDPSFANSVYDITKQRNDYVLNRVDTNSRGHNTNEMAKAPARKLQLHSDSFDASELYLSHDLSMAVYESDEKDASRNDSECKDGEKHIEFSGPMLSRPQRMDDMLLHRNESFIRRKSRFERDK
ncbi:cyclin-dependent kinase C-2 C [Ziziphus jujuba]|uniref:Cyclin-dependent kinase C-2 C n=1 Tax=Ziziphus jujuba TaxID=326968 RepID=A0A6P3ZJ50_ZIZJJ|nr:cyclin-dependent kinase C-2 C [Ziziphus jujuba]